MVEERSSLALTLALLKDAMAVNTPSCHLVALKAWKRDRES